MKNDRPINNETTSVHEPMAAYGTAIVSRRTKQTSSDFDKELEDVWNNLSDEQLKSMPGVYTIGELKEEIKKSEESGTLTQEEALAKFAEWGFVL